MLNIQTLLGKAAAKVLLIAALTSPIVRPTKVADFESVSVQVYVRVEKGAYYGSGVVLRSSDEGSDILTNKHVCDDVPNGKGVVLLKNKPYSIMAIKPGSHADVCLMHVSENLGVTVEVSTDKLKFGDAIATAGYPFELPLIVQFGHISYVISDSDERAAVLSVLAQPGSSGSGVFDSKGRLIGLVMAIKVSKGDIGFALAVTRADMVRFLNVEAPKLPWIEVPGAKTAK